MSLEILSASAGDTRALGRRLANLLRPGDIVLLAGDLGAGKTVFASGVAEGLGVAEQVTSPTFVLARPYSGLLPLVHADAYRLGSFGELDDLGLLELAHDGVLVVEWGHAVARGFPEDRLMVQIDVVEEDTRRISLTPMGAWTRRPLEEVAA